MAEIDDLSVKFDADAKQADSALEKLVSQLESVCGVLGKITHSDSFAKMSSDAKAASESMKDITASTKRVSSEIGGQMKKAGNSIKELEKPVKETFKSIEDVMEKLGQKSIDLKPEIDVSNISKEQKKYTDQMRKAQNDINRVLSSTSPEKQIRSLDKYVVKINEARNALEELKNVSTVSMPVQNMDNVPIHFWNEAKDTVKELADEEQRVVKYAGEWNGVPIPQELLKVTEITDTLEDSMSDFEKVLNGIKPFEFTGNFFEMEKWVDDLNKSLISLLDKQERLSDIGANMDTQRMRSVNYDIEKIIKTLDKYEAKVEEARKSGQLDIKIPSIDEYLTETQKQARESAVKISEEFKKAKISVPIEGFSEIEKEIQKVKKQYDELVKTIQIKAQSTDFYGASGSYKQKQAELAALREEYQRLINKQKELSFDESAIKSAKLSNSIKTTSDVTRKLASAFSSISFTSFPSFLSGIGSSASQLPSIFSTITLAVDGTSASLSGLQAAIPIIGAILTILSTFLNVVKKIANVAKSVATKVIGAFKKMLSGIKKVAVAIGNIISSIGSKFSEMGLGIDISASSMFKNIMKFFVALGRRVRSLAVTSVTKTFSDALSALASKSQELDYNLTTLKKNLATLGATIVSAFEPILNAVIPILNVFIEKLISITSMVGQLIAALFGRTSFKVPTVSVKGYAEALDDASDSAKKLKGNLQGFDKLNVLSSEDKTSGKTGSAGDTTYGFEDRPISSKLSNLAKKLKDMWDKGDFTELGKWLGDALAKALGSIPWDKIKRMARKLAKSLATLINGFIKGEFDGKSIGYWIGHTLAEAINTAFEFLNEFVDQIDWKELGKFFADGINEFMNALDWDLIIDTFEKGAKGLAELINNFNDLFEWEKFGQTIANVFNTITTTIYNFFNELDLYEIASNIGKAVRSLADNIDWNDFLQMAQTLGQKLKDAIQGLVDSGFISSCGEILGNILRGVVDWAFEFFTNLPYEELGEQIGQFINKIFDSLSEVDESGESGWQKLGKTISAIAKGLLEMFIKAYNEIDMTALQNGIVEMLEGINFAQIFTDAFLLISNLKAGLLSLFIAAIVGIQSSLQESFRNAVTNAIRYALSGQQIKIPVVVQAGIETGMNIGKNALKKYGVKGYASGGFIEPATYFKAGEGGVPEILGTVGGRSAVAGGQEITGIADAVYSTGQTEAQLLSAAVQFLQVIANKDFSISSSDAFNAIRDEAHSYEKRTGDKAFT